MSDPFATHMMRLQHADGTVFAENLFCQLDTFNLPYNAEASTYSPVYTDWYDLYSIGWVEPLPVRSDYFVDQATGTKYSMFSTVFVGPDTVQLRITKYSGTN